MIMIDIHICGCVLLNSPNFKDARVHQERTD